MRGVLPKRLALRWLGALDGVFARVLEALDALAELMRDPHAQAFCRTRLEMFDAKFALYKARRAEARAGGFYLRRDQLRAEAAAIRVQCRTRARRGARGDAAARAERAERRERMAAGARYIQALIRGARTRRG